MLDFTWKLFSQTGNIEAYLLLKELENDHDRKEIIPSETEKVNSLETKM